LRVLDAEAEEAAPLEAAFREELTNTARREGVQLSSQQEVAEALAGLGRADCAESEACLAQLARRVRARCVVQVSMAAFSPVRRVTARMVDSAGAEVPEGTVREMGGGRAKGTPRALLATALGRLPWKVARTLPLPVERVEAPAPSAVAVAAPLPSPLEPAPPPSSVAGPSGTRLASYALMGAGVVGLGVGTFMHLQAGADMRRLQGWHEGDLSAADARALQQSLRGSAVVVPSLLGAGAALLATGGALFFLNPDSSAPALMGAVVPGPAGAGVVLSGGF